MLSNSDAAGALTGGVGWATLLEDPAAGVEVVQAPFFPGGSSAAAYAARKTEQVAPDVVVVPMGTYGFTMRYVEYRVRKLLGRRLAARYKRAERSFDSRTREASEPPAGLNALARRTLRRTIGASPAVSQRAMTRYCVETLDALARFEDTAVVLVIGYPGVGQLVRYEADRERFFAELAAVANRHRFRIVRVVEALGDLPLADALIDDIHLTPAGHERLARSIGEALRPSL